MNMKLFLEMLDKAGPRDIERMKKLLGEKSTGRRRPTIRGTEGDSGIAGKAKAEAQAAAASMKEIIRGVLIGDDFQALTSIPQQLKVSIDEMYKSSKMFVEAGYTGQMYFDFTKAISTANKASLDLTGNITAGANVLHRFAQNSKAFAITTSGEFQDSLIKSGIVLQQVGFDMTQFAEIVETSAFAFNQNKEEIEQVTSTLIQVQREIPVAADTLARNFKSAQEKLAYSADKMMDTFIELQKTSVTTGVSYDNLMSSFGESLDTFDDAANKAGRLNQILGKSVFNSMELLTMTESERATTIRDRLMESGRGIEEMGKFELRALSKTLGMSLTDTRKFLRGDLAIDEGGMMKKIEAQDPTTLKTKKLTESLDDLTKVYLSNLRPAEKLALQMGKSGRQLAIETLKLEKNFKRMLAKGLSFEQALVGSTAILHGLADKDKIRGRTPGGVAFVEANVIAVTAARQAVKAMRDQNKTVLKSLFNGFQVALTGLFTGKSPLTAAVATGVSSAVMESFGKMTLKGKLEGQFINLSLFPVKK